MSAWRDWGNCMTLASTSNLRREQSQALPFEYVSEEERLYLMSSPKELWVDMTEKTFFPLRAIKCLFITVSRMCFFQMFFLFAQYRLSPTRYNASQWSSVLPYRFFTDIVFRSGFNSAGCDWVRWSLTPWLLTLILLRFAQRVLLEELLLNFCAGSIWDDTDATVAEFVILFEFGVSEWLICCCDSGAGALEIFS